jgi:hypothetical protein
MNSSDRATLTAYFLVPNNTKRLNRVTLTPKKTG